MIWFNLLPIFVRLEQKTPTHIRIWANIHEKNKKINTIDLNKIHIEANDSYWYHAYWRTIVRKQNGRHTVLHHNNPNHNQTQCHREWVNTSLLWVRSFLFTLFLVCAQMILMVIYCSEFHIPGMEIICVNYGYRKKITLWRINYICMH